MGRSLTFCVRCGPTTVTQIFSKPESQTGSGLAIRLVSLVKADSSGLCGFLALQALLAVCAEQCW